MVSLCFGVPPIRSLKLFQMSKSLPASLQGDEPEGDDERGPRDERESYRREKRFWKRNSKSTSIMSTGNVPVVGNGGNVGVGGNTTRNSPTSVTDRKSKTTQDYNLTSGEWQKIPKVEIVQHVDSEEGSGKDSNPDSKLDSKEEEPRSDSSK